MRPVCHEMIKNENRLLFQSLLLAAAGTGALVLALGSVDLVTHGEFHLAGIAALGLAHGGQPVAQFVVFLRVEQVVTCHLDGEAVVQEGLGSTDVEHINRLGQGDIL